MTKKSNYKIEGRPSTIFRTVKNKENPYVQIDQRPIVNNDKLSWKAKGILTYLMSRPDGWEVNITDLVNRSSDGEISVRSGVKELKDAGHLNYIANRDEKGQFSGWLIEVHEVPNSPHTMFPTSGFPTSGEHSTSIKENHNINDNNSNEDSFSNLSSKEINELYEG